MQESNSPQPQVVQPRRRRWSIVAAGVLLTSLAAWFGFQGEEPEGAKEEEAAPAAANLVTLPRADEPEPVSVIDSPQHKNALLLRVEEAELAAKRNQFDAYVAVEVGNAQIKRGDDMAQAASLAIRAATLPPGAEREALIAEAQKLIAQADAKSAESMQFRAAQEAERERRYGPRGQ